MTIGPEPITRIFSRSSRRGTSSVLPLLGCSLGDDLDRVTRRIAREASFASGDRTRLLDVAVVRAEVVDERLEVVHSQTEVSILRWVVRIDQEVHLLTADLEPPPPVRSLGRFVDRG